MLTRELEFTALPDLAPDAPIPATIATTTSVIRDGLGEILDCTPTGVDLSRAPLPLIRVHDAQNLAVGVVENLSADGQRVTGMVRFGSSPEAQQIRADVLAGIHRSLSVGYRLLDDGRTAGRDAFIYRWQPFEVSIVPIPADPKAGFFRHLEQKNMNAPSVAREITDLCKRHNVPHLAGDLIANERTIEQARADILKHLAQCDAATVTRPPMGYIGNNQAESAPLADTLAARMGIKVDAPVETRASVVELAQRALERAGQRVDARMSRADIVTRALHGTSDFPGALGDAVGRVLAAAFEHAPAALKTVARAVELPDFRQRHALAMGSAPSLDKVNERGEFKHGSMIEEGPASYKLETYGRIFGITRQALVNDDLGAFADTARAFGQAAAQREAAILTALLLSNPAVADGVALFHADHGNLASTAASALSLTALAEAVRALRLQTDIGGELLALEPGAIVVPASLEMTARQLVAQITPAEHSAVNPFGNLAVVVEPRLDAASTKAWYLVAAGSSALEYAYLSGNAGVQVETREGWEVDGLEVKARLDFGAAFVSHRGWIKNTGE